MQSFQEIAFYRPVEISNGDVVSMRVLALLVLSTITLAACDSVYGPTPQYVSQRSSIMTGSHLPQPDLQQPNVEVVGASAIGGLNATGGHAKASGGGS